jgi:hypothetical protein
MYQIFIEIHKTLANMINLYPLLVGVWGLFNYLRKQAPDGSYNGALALGAGLFAVEALVGVALLLLGLAPNRSVHFLYGVTIALVVPGIFAFTRGRNSTRESLLYGLGMLFIWGLAERAAVTATGAGG